MPINDLTDYAELNRRVEEQIRRIEVALMRSLKYVGEIVVNTARQKVLKIPNLKRYENRSGNLCSSIGFVISLDGRIQFQSSFEVVKDGAQGAKEGLAFAKQLASQYSQGIALICVAGKNYAIHLSNRKYDVLDTAELEAEALIPQMLESLKI